MSVIAIVLVTERADEESERTGDQTGYYLLYWNGQIAFGS